MFKALEKVEPVGHTIFRVVIWILSLPYHRFFTRNTLWPAQEITRCANAGFEPGTTERQRLHSLLCDWQERKKNELSFVSIMSIALTAVVSASFSWNVIDNAFWLGPAMWYATLMWAVFGIIVTAQQLATLASIGDLPKDHAVVPTETLRRHLYQFVSATPADEHQRQQQHDAPRGERNRRSPQWTMSWRSIFIWQLPLMSFGYAFLLYIVGLTVVVCTPLRHELSGDNFKIAMFYIASCTIAVALFVYSATLGYSTIELAEDKGHWEHVTLARAATMEMSAGGPPPGPAGPAGPKEYETLMRSLTGMT